MNQEKDPFGLNFSGPDITAADPFIDDLNYCISLIEKDECNQSLRRIYCRTLFAAVEGSLNYIKPSLRHFNESMIRPLATMLDNAEVVHEIRCLKDVVPVQEANLLLDVTLRVNERGDAKPSLNFTNFKPNFKFIFNMVDRIYKLNCSPNYREDQGWTALEKSIDIRNRITHPKADYSEFVSDDELHQIVAAHNWFMPFFNDVLREIGEAMVNLTSEISECKDPQIKDSLEQMQKLIIRHENSKERENP
jgi:hypothetical protein